MRRTRIKRMAGALMSLLLTLLLMILPAAAEENSQVLLLDGAALLQGTQSTSLRAQAQDLAELTGWDVRIVTTADAEGKTSEEYLEDYYMDHYRQDDGVAYLIDMDNREIHISTSGDAIYYLTDERIERMLDSAYDRVTEQAYSDAFSVMMEMTASYYQRGIDSDQYTFDRDTGKIVYYQPPKSLSLVEILLSLGAGILTALGIGGSVSARYRMKRGGYRYSLKGNSEVRLTRKLDTQVNRFVTTRRIPRDPPPSGGGSHSGGGHQSTVHTGSGGHSFGGGGRKF